MSRLVLMGSGETAPSLVGVHRGLLESLPRPAACWFDTPYGFQENAAILSQKTVDFFRESLGTPLQIASLLSEDVAESDKQTAYGVAQESNYLVSGPGSPTYVLRHWKGSALPTLFVDKLRAAHNVVVFASATACAVGRLCLPVYEIYKVGQKPHWLPGLDILGSLGFRAVVLPHFNNTVGGNHDTRYCYLGERRLRVLLSELESDLWIWGVDEHTALVIDLPSERFAVLGKGSLTLRQGDHTQVFASGCQGALDQLRNPSMTAAQTKIASELLPQTPVTQGLITELVWPLQKACEGALEQGQGELAVASLLKIEQILDQWSGDSDTHHRQLARATFRRLLFELGESAFRGPRDSRTVVGPLVETLLSLRETARAEGRYDLSDRVRLALDGYGIELRDTREGPTWTLRSSEPAKPARMTYKQEPVEAGRAGCPIDPT